MNSGSDGFWLGMHISSIWHPGMAGNEGVLERYD